MPTVAELTENYLKEHRSIRNMLRLGLINYSALARHISLELGMQKTVSNEAVLMAIRRYKEKISDELSEEDIIRLFNNSNIEIKNNIVTFTVNKRVYPDLLIEVERKIKHDKGLFFSIEGTKTITLIVQEPHEELIDDELEKDIINKKEKLSLITISSPGIDQIPGAVSYMTGLFFENGINIEEFMSCYDDTLIVIESKFISKIIKIFQF